MKRYLPHRRTNLLTAFMACLAFTLWATGCDTAPPDPATSTPPVTALARVTPTPLPAQSTATPRPTVTPRPTSPSAPTLPPNTPIPPPTADVETATPVPPTPTPVPPTPVPPTPVPPTPLPPQPTATPAPDGSPTPQTSTGWQATYFGNTGLRGDPLLAREDERINFHWGAAAPASGVPRDGFSVRWTRRVQFAGGQYVFYARGSDGVRVYINDVAIVDDWTQGRPELFRVPIGLESGVYNLRVEHFTAAGSAELQVWWEDAAVADWIGSYFANPTLTEPPALVRSDEAIDFDWETFAPDDSLPIDNFSVRWLDTLLFEDGLYRFTAASDDGLRLYVDGLRLLDLWRDGEVAGEATVWLPAGRHRVMVEYYERRQRAEVSVDWTRLDFDISLWRGEYFANPDLLGVPALVRDDSAPRFDWGNGAPGAGLPDDRFSARWTRALSLEEGVYQFSATSGGGVRIYVGDQLVLDAWQPGDPTAPRTNTAIVGGLQTVIVEYFDPGGAAGISVEWVRLGPIPR